MKRIGAGELNKVITIYKAPVSTGETDDNGLPIQPKPKEIKRRAKVVNSSYKKMELLVSEGITGYNSLDFTFRFTIIDKTKDYIEYNGSKYNIKSAVDLYNDKTYILATGVCIDG